MQTVLEEGQTGKELAVLKDDMDSASGTPVELFQAGVTSTQENNLEGC
jgi:hypothetical protein